MFGEGKKIGCFFSFQLCFYYQVLKLIFFFDQFLQDDFLYLSFQTEPTKNDNDSSSLNSLFLLYRDDFLQLHVFFTTKIDNMFCKIDTDFFCHLCCRFLSNLLGQLSHLIFCLGLNKCSTASKCLS